MNYVITGSLIRQGRLTDIGNDLIMLTMTEILITHLSPAVGIEPTEGLAMEFDGFKSKFAHLANGPHGALTFEGSRETGAD